MQIVQKARQQIWLLLLILVISSNTVLYRTDFGISILPVETKSVVLGSMLDLVIVAPLLILAWKRKKSLKTLAILMAGGLVLTRFLIPMPYLEPFAAITWVGVAVEATLLLLELLLIVTFLRYMPKIIKATKKSSSPMIFAFPNAVDQFVYKQPIIHVICSEMLMFYYAFISWRKKPVNAINTITLHHNSSYIAFQVMLIHAIVLETLGVHWWLHDKAPLISLILLIFNIYSVIFILADIQTVRLNPTKITENQLFISLGLMKRMEIKWSDIQEVIVDSEQLEQKIGDDTIDFVARDFEEVYPDVILKLKEPKEATLIMGIKKSYSKVAIRTDQPLALKSALELYTNYK